MLGGLTLHGRLPVGAAPAAGSSGTTAELELDFAASGGFSWYDARRRVDFVGATAARSRPEVGFAGLHGRVGLRVGAPRGAPGWYGRAGLAGHASYVSVDDFAERNAGLAALRIDETGELYGALRPGVEIGGRWQLGRVALRPYARLGGTFLVGDGDARLRGRLTHAPVEVGTAALRSAVERRFIDAGGGVALLWGERLELRLGYQGRFAPDGDTRVHQGSLQLGLRF